MSWTVSNLRCLLERTFLSKKAASLQKKNHKYWGVVLSALTSRKSGALFQFLKGRWLQRLKRQAAAKKARCYDFIMALPNGFDTVIGEGGATLSGGKRQRISIARAIMKDAPIIILDEATANVDPENEKELMEAVAELTHDKTVIMIVHRLKTVRHADKIFVVDHGEIVQQGTHDELVAVDGLYRRFVVERQQAAGWKV